MRFSVLSSSSNGNSVYLEVDNKKYIIDAGFSYKSLSLKALSLNLKIDDIDAIFISHEHTDHVSGLASLQKNTKAKIYITKKTYKALKDKDKERLDPINLKFFNADEEFNVDELLILPFKTNHDAADSVGFKFKYKDKELVYLTDTGHFDVREDLINKDAYILESNHEKDMLMLSSRPWQLIDRIQSDFGHLSNEQSVEIFSKLVGPKTKNLVLYHLSNECNTKDIALLTYKNYFKNNNIINNINIIVSNDKIPTQIIEV